VHLSDTGTSFTNLMVSGHPEITDDVPPNTKVALSGVGTVCLRCEATGSNYIDVKGIQLLIGQNNIVGLPAGTLIIVGHASALIHTSSSLP